MTDAESLLWRHLRGNNMGVKFRRQHPFGRYILDFYSEQAHLAIELDGGQHYTEHGAESDRQRTEVLESAGVLVLRFSDREALTETTSVLQEIWRAVRGYNPSP